MKRVLIISILSIAVIAVVLVTLSGKNNNPQNPMPVYFADQEFIVDKDNPEYSKKQAEQIHNIIKEIKAPKHFVDYVDFMEYYEKYVVPGYGSGTGGYGDSTKFGYFTFICTELPQLQKHRVFVYQTDKPNGEYEFFEDFYYDGYHPPSIIFASQFDTLYYLNDLQQGKIIRKKKIN
ncbi:MAG: hypothetical protein MI922_03315 [Bacteroidales bacterium]|nr:hypothetical protein [Bacteroidales bacterium]